MPKPSIACLLAGWAPQETRAEPSLLCWLSVADCKAPPELEHGFVTFSSRNNLTTYRAAIQYHCQHPYYHMAPNSTGERWGRAASPRHGAGGCVAVRACVRAFRSGGSLGCSASSRRWM